MAAAVGTPATIEGSNFVFDNDGNKYIAASKRPDGTMRKQRRVKDGYVPQDEVAKYECGPATAQALRAQNGPVGCMFVEDKKEDRPMSKNARKKAKLREKKRIINSKDDNDLKVDEVTHSMDKVRVSECGSDHSSSGPANDGFQVVNGRKGSNSNQPANQPQAEMAAQAADFEKELQKRLKNLTKKVRQIEELEKKIKDAEIQKPTVDEVEKIGKKAGFLEEISLIQEQLNFI